MNMLLAMILTTSIKGLPSCGSKLKQMERTLSQWSSETRKVSANNETHRYHTVKKDGTTVFFTVLATRATLGYDQQLFGFRLDSACEFDGEEGVLMFKVEAKK